MHARYFSSVMVRLLSVDPGRDWHLENPESWNRYAYARDNPIRYQDVDGRFVVVPHELRSTISITYANSATFRRLYDAVHRDRSIIRKLSIGPMQSGQSDRAETTRDRSANSLITAGGRIALDSSGHPVVGLVLNTILGPGDLGPEAGHELRHGTEFRIYGIPARAPDAHPSAGGIETDTATAVEKQISSELLASRMQNRLTPEQESNLFDVPERCGTGSRNCPKFEAKVDAGPSTDPRPPL